MHRASNSSSLAYSLKDGPSFNEAMKDPAWRKSINDELSQMESVKAWKWDYKPDNVDPLRFIWVLKLKINDVTGEKKYKSRLVVDGSQQDESQYGKTFASMPSANSQKVFMSIITQRGMKTCAIDVVGAYLQTDIDKDIWMRPPKGMIVPKEHQGKYLKLLKAIYGTKQAALLFETFRDNLLKEYGFKSCPFEPSMFKMETQSGKWLFVSWHSDDGKLAADDSADSDKFVKWLGTKVGIKVDSSNVRLHLGIREEYGQGFSTWDQEAYIAATVDSFLEKKKHPSGQDCVSKLPWVDVDETDFDWIGEQPADDVEFMKTRDYWSLIGCFQYIQLTRSADCGYAIGRLASHASRPRRIHWTSAQRLLAYLSGTRSKKLVFRKDKTLGAHMVNLVSYSDSNFAQDTFTRKSISGVAIILNGVGVVVTSTSQPTVADSTVSAEVRALCSVAKGVCWIRSLLDWFGYPQVLPSSIWCDNFGAVRNVEDGAKRHKTKHMDVQYMFIRDLVKQGLITVRHIGTDKMVADVLTKGLPRAKLELFSEALGLFKGSVEEGSLGVAMASRVNRQRSLWN